MNAIKAILNAIFNLFNRVPEVTDKTADVLVKSVSTVDKYADQILYDAERSAQQAYDVLIQDFGSEEELARKVEARKQFTKSIM